MPFSLRAWVRSLAAPASTARRPARLRLEALEAKLVPTAYVVNTTLDLLNDTTGGQVTLRDALTAIDAQAASGDAAAGTASNTIAFAIGAAGSVQTIVVTSALPTLTHQTTIDGRTQGGANYAGPPLVVLNGANAGANADGLSVAAGGSGSTVRGLVVQQFVGNGILITGASGVAVAGNFIGTDVAGTAAFGNVSEGVLLAGGANHNTIGGLGAGDGNVVSGNDQNGIVVEDAGTSGNVLFGNKIGTDANGTAALGNAVAGILIDIDAANDTIGGTAAGAGNVVSGNLSQNVVIAGSSVSGNAVLGNMIGTDVQGTAGLNPAADGVYLAAARDNTIGGTAAGAGNVISGNRIGVYVSSGTTGTVVSGNKIGTTVRGTAAVGNAGGGVAVTFGASANTVGGTAAGAGNLISGNNSFGVLINGFGTTRNAVLGNRIGTDVSGTAAVGNAGDGVLIGGRAVANTVGGSTAGAINLISGNRGNGVRIDGVGSSGNAVRGNRLGTSAPGTAAVGNAGDGVLVSGQAANNTVGGVGAGNLIDGNAAGVEIDGASGTAVLGNYVGVAVTGTAALANAGDGVLVHDAAANNTVGGSTAGRGTSSPATPATASRSPAPARPGTPSSAAASAPMSTR